MELNAAQNVYLNGLDTKYRAYVSGFGGGKTFVGCLDLLIFASQNPKTRQGYFGPTFPSIRDIFFPTIEEAAHLMGFVVDIKVSDKEVHLYRNGFYYGTIICRSMDNPGSIVGFKIARALVDEIDILPMDKAKLAWSKIIARLRLVIPGIVNGIGVTTTPEGFKFVYNQFKLDPTVSYSMVQSTTHENEKYLPPDYIDTLLETYTEELASAYINGQFVNLTSGTVYKSYDRATHRSCEVINEDEPLFIGMDFNVTKMAFTVYVRRGDVWHAVDEAKDGYDTPAMIDLIKERYTVNRIHIYPDATGKNRKSVGASETDIALLEKAGFSVRAHNTNPAVKDRINATNIAFEKGLLRVNDTKCPETARCLEQQCYDINGQPDKKSGNDHQNDATTYPIAYEMPIIRPATKLNVTFSM
jgi:hypothetical protein